MWGIPAPERHGPMLRRMVAQNMLLFVSRRLALAAFGLCVACMAAVVPSETMFAAEVTDRDALVALYQATDGDNWYRNDNWLTDAPIYTWYGVTTDTRGRVVELDLLENGLSGSIPSELGRLTGLEWLDLSDNRLSGPIPPELGNLINLDFMYLSSNQLSGEIPPELGNLASLTALFLSDNRLSGTIPPELGNLTNLEGLSLWGNELSGSIPSELTNLTNLDYLTLGYGNQFSGCIPETWRNIERNGLEELGLPICVTPSPILTATDREVLVVLYQTTDGPNWLRSDNWLTDAPIDTWYGVNTDINGRVIELSLSENGLSGVIPSELGNLSHLEWLALYDNELGGAIPSELGNLTNLIDLYLHSNQLTGVIPSELGNLANLEWSEQRFSLGDVMTFTARQNEA